MSSTTAFQLPWYIRLANRAAGALGVGPSLEPAALMDRARAETGLRDFGAPEFREGLEVFVESLNRDADLSPIGRLGIGGMILTLLANRLRIQQARLRDPHCFRADLKAPVVILGLPRSGTTLLHRLMAQDPKFRTLPFWRLFKPVSPESERSIRREVDRVLWLRRQMTPTLDRKHFTRSDSAEECIWLLNFSFVSHGLWVSAPVYGYLDWLAQADRKPAYREYGELLRFLQCEEPERTFLLKAPSHAGSLEELQEALPSVRIIQMHRDPVEVCSSVTSLFATLHAAVSRRLDLERLGRETCALLHREMKRSQQARRRLQCPILDIRYVDLVADPVATVREVYERFDLDWSEALESRLVEYVRSHPQGRYGRHRHDLATFGLCEDDVARLFAPYRHVLQRRRSRPTPEDDGGRAPGSPEA